MHGLSIVLTLRSIRGLRVSRVCKPTDEGMIRCCWESMEVGQKVSLGKRMALSSTPKAFQVAFRKIERVYLHACKVDTLEAWGKFQRV